MKLSFTLVLLFLAISGFDAEEECSLASLQRCFKELDDEVELVTEEHQNFTELNYQHCHQNRYSPAAIILVKSTRNVQTAVKCLRRLKCPFTVKSGGGSYENYSSGGNGYYVIALRGMRNVTASRETLVATIEAGATVGDIVMPLYEKYRLTVGVGLSSIVGVGGLALGGGWGFFARQEGLLTQNIVEMTVVDANGNVLIANESENNDLFVALRGAGQNSFAIVTEFKFRAFDVSNDYAMIEVSASFDQLRLVFQRWQSYISENHPKITAVLYFTPDVVQVTILINTRDVAERAQLIENVEAHFKLTDSASTVRIFNFKELYEFFATLTMEGFKFQDAKSFFVHRIMSEKELDRLMGVLNETFAISSRIFFEFVQFGGAIEAKDRRTSYIHANALYTFESYVTQEDSVEQDTLAMRYFFNNAHFIDSGYSYQNNVDSSDDIARYYGPKLPFLMRVKCKYDSENLFHFPKSIPLPRYCRYRKKCAKLDLLKTLKFTE